MANIKVRDATLEDYLTIAEFNILMAKETEDKDLNRDLVTKGCKDCLLNPAYGRYCVAFEESNPGKIIGSLMITFEMSPVLGGMIYWI